MSQVEHLPCASIVVTPIRTLIELNALLSDRKDVQIAVHKPAAQAIRAALLEACEVVHPGLEYGGCDHFTMKSGDVTWTVSIVSLFEDGVTMLVTVEQLDALTDLLAILPKVPAALLDAHKVATAFIDQAYKSLTPDTVD